MAVYEIKAIGPLSIKGTLVDPGTVVALVETTHALDGVLSAVRTGQVVSTVRENKQKSRGGSRTGLKKE